MSDTVKLTSDIVGKLAAVMADVQAVAKTEKNQKQGYMFRGIDAVLRAVAPALRTHGVVVAPEIVSVDREHVLSGQNKTPMLAVHVVVVYQFYAASDGSSLGVKVAGEAMDAGDKATAKAMSVAFRTALLQTLALPTDEPDPDETSYERAAPDGGAHPVTAIRTRVKALGLVEEMAALLADQYGTNKLVDLGPAQWEEIAGLLDDPDGLRARYATEVAG